MADHAEPKELADYYDIHDASAELEGAVPELASTTEPMVTYALRLPKPVLDRLRAVADARSEKVTSLMRSWLEERLVSEETNPPPPTAEPLACGALAPAPAQVHPTARALKIWTPIPDGTNFRLMA